MSQSPPLSPIFLAGKILLDTSMVQSWLNLINLLIPLTSGELLNQLTISQTQLVTLLALPVDPAVVTGSIITPITYVNDLKNTLAVYEHEFNGFQGNPNLYQNVTYEVDSVMIQYSSFYFNGGYGKLAIY